MNQYTASEMSYAGSGASPARQAWDDQPGLRKVAVVGLGYWGPNWVRNLSQNARVERVVACDMDASRRLRISQQLPSIETAECLDRIVQDDDVEAAIVATPVGTHFPIARALLQAGKSVLVEKPLATSREQAKELTRLAQREGLTLMVGHTFEYSAPVRAIAEIIASGELGEILYITSTRANLGLFQQDVNVAWDLATHDISIILMLLGRMPEAVSCHGRSHYRRGVEDVAMLAMHFPGKVVAFVHVSWLDPNKIRRTTIVGSRKMLVYDDTDLREKIRIYDKGVSVHRYYDDHADFQFAYRNGAMRVVSVTEVEPLRVECEHLIDCVLTGLKPLTDGCNGTRVVSVLEAADASMRNGGEMAAVPRLAME